MLRDSSDGEGGEDLETVSRAMPHWTMCDYLWYFGTCQTLQPVEQRTRETVGA
jgi:hypothetical protein